MSEILLPLSDVLVSTEAIRTGTLVPQATPILSSRMPPEAYPPNEVEWLTVAQKVTFQVDGIRLSGFKKYALKELPGASIKITHSEAVAGDSRYSVEIGPVEVPVGFTLTSLTLVETQ